MRTSRCRALLFGALLLVGAAGLMLMSGGCAGAPATPGNQDNNTEQWTVRGTVLNASDTPIDGATVQLNTNTVAGTESAQDGSFRFTNVPPGTYKVIASYAGATDYLSGASDAFTLSSDNPSVSVTVRVTGSGPPPPPWD
jgi:hypothetical protein